MRSIYLTDQYTHIILLYIQHVVCRPLLPFVCNFLLTRTQLGHLRFEYVEQNSDCDFYNPFAHIVYTYIHCRCMPINLNYLLWSSAKNYQCVYALLYEHNRLDRGRAFLQFIYYIANLFLLLLFYHRPLPCVGT